MRFHVIQYFARNLTAATLTLSATVLAATSVRAEGPFSALSGSWSGSGTAHFDNGRAERITCRAYYSGDRVNLTLALRCATPSTNVNLRGSLVASGNHIRGDWQETTFGASGGAEGSASGGSMRLRLSGSADGLLIVSTSGSSQSVSISTSGVALQRVSINLHRR